MTMYTALGNLFQANVPIDWTVFHYFSPGNKITLLNYPFQRKFYSFPEYPTNDWNPFFHPLVGSSLFLKEHAVGPLLLLSGAGFLEMGIVGGFVASQ